MGKTMMNSPPPLTHCRHVHSPRASKATRDDDDTRGEHSDRPFEFIFRRTSSSDSESTAEWPQGLLSKLSTEKEEARDMPPGGEHQLLKRSNPVMPTMLSSDLPDDVSVHKTDSVLNQRPFYVIKFDAQGNGQVIEQPLVSFTPPIANRKRLRSKDVVPIAKQIKKTPAVQKKKEETSMWYMPDGSHLEKFAEAMEALLLPTMCAGAISKSNLGALTPWHSSASMIIHHEPKACRNRHAHQTSPFQHKSYMATTISACRAF